MSAAAKLNPQPNIKLVVQKGPHSGQRFAFSKSKITIGRSPENDIILVNDPLISRQHAYIQISNNDVEIINLSLKNPILVNNEGVNKWKLTNDTVFMIGDTEFLIQIENLQSVVVVKPTVPESFASSAAAKNSLKLVPKNTAPAPARPVPKAFSPAPVMPSQAHSSPSPQMQTAPPPQFSQTVTASPKKNNFMMIAILVLAVIGGGLYWWLNDSGKAKSSKKQTLKYADETEIKLKSKDVEESFKKQENTARLKQSSAYLRSEENFSKGMRAFQLGNYGSAIELFQLTLTTNSEHVLAKRYLYLAKVRFDEIVKAKLELGQSYFERNNFKLCGSQFQQVIDMLKSKEMLQGSSKNTNLQLAEIMLKKCNFAAEGIH